MKKPQRSLKELTQEFSSLEGIFRDCSSIDEAVKRLENHVYFNIKREKAVYGYFDRENEPQLKDICGFSQAVDISKFGETASRYLLKMLKLISAKNTVDRVKLREALGDIGNAFVLPDLLVELRKDKEGIEESFYGDIVRLEEELDEWKTAKDRILHKFDGRSIELLENIISYLDGLKRAHKESPNNERAVTEQKKFLLRSKIIDLLEANPETLTKYYRFFLTLDKEIISDAIDIVTAAVNTEQLKELGNSLENAIQDGSLDYDFKIHAEIVIARHADAFAKNFELIPKVSTITQVLAHLDAHLYSAGNRDGKKTWLNDTALENILFKTFQKVDDKFSSDFSKDHKSQEPVLTANLLRDFQDAFKPISADLEVLGHRLAKGPLKFNLTYRDTQAQEAKWHADLAFLLKCRVTDRMLKTHAVLVQCKKMKFNDKSGRFIESYDIDMHQCHNLLKQSPWSYYFLYGPDSPPVQTLVVPAAAIRGIIEARLSAKDIVFFRESTKDDSTSRSVTKKQIEGVAHTLADFMLYDFINCWAGDEFPKVTMLAEGKTVEEREGEEFEVQDSPSAKFIVDIEITQEITGNG